eukprot:TRINITY_DN3109_c0_g1_i1.p1 TRINITY_DN3109_c0_g1~~TRINITY_DN3109_c0_g1_i1.p1  ORF type:complete len:345 (+),score=107.99 TRINITY_DN3109_c0_g1_i1:142-1176(+)
MFGFPRYTHEPRYHRGPVYTDPYSGYDAYDSYDPFSPFGSRGGRQHLYERQRAEEQRRNQERKRQLAAKKARQAKLKQYNDAATKIQQAWRAHHAQQVFEQQDDAAFVITDFVRDYAAFVKARKVLASVRKLNTLHKQLHDMIDEFQSNMRGYRHLLMFNDQVEKLIFKLDEIQHHRSSFVRNKRKAIVKDAQDALRVSDQLLTTMKRKLAVIVAVLRQRFQARKLATSQKAARVIQRFIRGVPLIKAAKQARRDLSALKRAAEEVACLQAQLVTKLQALQHEATAVMDTSSDEWVTSRADAIQDKSEKLLSSLQAIQWAYVEDKAAAVTQPSTKRSKFEDQQA